LAPPNKAELETRLRKRGLDPEEKIKERLATADLELEQSKVEGFHDKIIINDDLEVTFKELESYIFGLGDETVKENVDEDTLVAISAEVEMADNETPVLEKAEE